MTPLDLLIIVCAIASVVFAAIAAAAWLQKRPRPPRPPVVDEQPSRRWIALPGQRIEHGATGFSITLHTGMTGPLYRLWSPEGRLLHECSDLPSLKHLGERLAAERDEFDCAALPELPRFHH